MTVADQLLEFSATGSPDAREDVVTAARLFAAFCQERGAEQHSARFPTLEPPTFELDTTGRRYLRIVMESGQRSVHCFIDATNGDILKAATWKAPAKDARGNLFETGTLRTILKRFDWAGGYLYKR